MLKAYKNLSLLMLNTDNRSEVFIIWRVYCCLLVLLIPDNRYKVLSVGRSTCISNYFLS